MVNKPNAKSSNARGLQKNSFSVRTDKRRVTTIVYLADCTVIYTNVYYNGNIKISVNPP